MTLFIISACFLFLAGPDGVGASIGRRAEAEPSLKDPSEFVRSGLDRFWTRCQCGEIVGPDHVHDHDHDDHVHQRGVNDHGDRRPWMAVLVFQSSKEEEEKESRIA